MNIRRLTRLALFTAIALLMHIVEGSLPPLFPYAPGVKMGLSNVISLIAVVILGYSDAFVILLLRCVLGSLFGNVSALMYSIPAGMVSLTIQVLLYHFLFPHISIMTISFTGAVAHNVTQIAIASVIVKANLLLMLPFTLLASIIAGVFVGLVSFFVIKALPQTLYLDRGPYKKQQNKQDKTEE